MIVARYPGAPKIFTNFGPYSRSGNWRSAGKRKFASEKQINSVRQRSLPNLTGFTEFVDGHRRDYLRRAHVFCQKALHHAFAALFEALYQRP
jgi:hypothetical protein